MIPSEDVERLLVEILTGKPPRTPDTPELATFRKKLEQDCADIRAKGGTVEIPHELPDTTTGQPLAFWDRVKRSLSE